jgi:dipeptidyl aminopeptidase/acylaminoacyl peptidase
MATSDTAQMQRLEDIARRFFDRPSFSSPVFLGLSKIAFLDDRSGVPQVSTVSLDDDARAVKSITSYPERVLSLTSNGRGGMVFGMDEGGNERQQLWRLDASGSPPVRITDRSDAIHEPGAMQPATSYVLYRSNARDEATFDIRGTAGNDQSADVWMESAGQAMPVAVSDDGQRALVIRINTNLDADVLLLERSGGEPVNLTAHEGEAWILGAEFHPDMQRVFVLTNEGAEFARLEAIEIASGARTVIVEDAWDVERFAISPDGLWVAIGVNENGWSRLAIHRLDSGEAIPVDATRGTIDRFSWAPDSSVVAFGISTATDPSRIMLAGIDGSVTTLGDEASIEQPPVVEPELIHYPTFDGRQIPAFFFRSPLPGPRPVLVEIHGGPESQRRLQYASAVPTDQFIQSLGISVLSLNVRGSTGYGKSYSHLDDKERRLDSVRDVAAAVDWLRQRDDVVGDRIGVMGQSYGGFMTLASLCFHPHLWSAAVDVVGIANFVSFLERTGPWRRKHRSEEYGFLEHDREMLERISPLNYVDEITAPLMVIHGRNDPRVPLFEAEQIVRALQERGRTVQLRVFDNEGHGLSKRENRISGYAEAAAFLLAHLSGTTTA